MADLLERLEAAKAEVERLQREVAAGPCRQAGHDWQSIGGRNASCKRDCSCSVPVNICAKCGDCDYGVNDDAMDIVEQCVLEKEVRSSLLKSNA